MDKNSAGIGPHQAEDELQGDALALTAPPGNNGGFAAGYRKTDAIDPDTNALRSYYPDFLIELEGGGSS